jgi:hypothetical protein
LRATESIRHYARQPISPAHKSDRREDDGGVEAIRTGAASKAEPWNTHAFVEREVGDAGGARRHTADDLVAGHEGQRRIGQLAVDHVQIRAAYAAGGNLDEHLARPGRRHLSLTHEERRARALEHHGVHPGHGVRLSLCAVRDYITRPAASPSLLQPPPRRLRRLTLPRFAGEG